jgi:hypothetical protein
MNQSNTLTPFLCRINSVLFLIPYKPSHPFRTSDQIYCVPIAYFLCVPHAPLISSFTSLYQWRMPSSGMLRHMALIRNDVSEELSSESPDLTRAIRRHIPEDGPLHSHRREILKSYIPLLMFNTARHGRASRPQSGCDIAIVMISRPFRPPAPAWNRVSAVNHGGRVPGVLTRIWWSVWNSDWCSARRQTHWIVLNDEKHVLFALGSWRCRGWTVSRLPLS